MFIGMTLINKLQRSSKSKCSLVSKWIFMTNVRIINHVIIICNGNIFQAESIEDACDLINGYCPWYLDQIQLKWNCSFQISCERLFNQMSHCTINACGTQIMQFRDTELYFIIICKFLLSNLFFIKVYTLFALYNLFYCHLECHSNFWVRPWNMLRFMFVHANLF